MALPSGRSLNSKTILERDWLGLVGTCRCRWWRRCGACLLRKVETEYKDHPGEDVENCRLSVLLFVLEAGSHDAQVGL